MSTTVHRQLDGGIDFAAEVMPDRPTVSFNLRFRSGTAYEPEDRLGVARLVEQTASKGTARHDGRGLADAFDAMGIQRGSSTRGETITFRCRCLPEFVDGAIDLYAEMLRTPTFPLDACRVATDLAIQDLAALEDEPMDLAHKLINDQAYGPRLGRTALGTVETLGRIRREDVEAYWAETFTARRMQVAAAGALDADRFAEKVASAFAGFGEATTEARDRIPLEFEPTNRHHAKDLEQDYMMVCWPGVPMDHPDEPVQRVMVGILSNGMSGRLFTEVREKQGLVYWVGAWVGHPRGSGMIHIGASTQPDRCDRTYATLLREIDRLTEDLTNDELRRVVTAITSQKEREADITRARADNLANDLFYFDRPIPVAEKLAKVRAVTIEDIRRYLNAHPRNRLSVLALGPRALVV